MSTPRAPAVVPAGAPLRLVLIRHGAWSPPAAPVPAETAPGSRTRAADPDGGLTAHGRAQARACGRWLRSVPLLSGSTFVLCSSPARRAQQTAEQLGLGPWRTDARLAPRNAGTAADGDAAREQIRLDPWHRRPPGGESLADLQARAESWVAEPDVADAEAVVAVCHAEVVLALRHVLEGAVGARPLAAGPGGPVYAPGNCDVVVYSRVDPAGAVADSFRWWAWVPEPWSAPPGWDARRLVPVG